MRRLGLLPLCLALGACQHVLRAPEPWPAWDAALRAQAPRAAIRDASAVVQNRECWRGVADLSADLVLVRERDRVRLLGRITDDRPLQQSRPERLRPRWWLMPVGCDAVTLSLAGGGAQEIEVTAALGSAGVAPEILGGQPGDTVRVWPTLTGARFELSLDLAARGGAALSRQPVTVTVHDFDGAADWSAHRTRIP